MISRLAVLSALAAFAACSFPENHRVPVPEPMPESEGHQFVMPDTVVPPGTERMTCWSPDWTPDRDYLVTSFESLQGTFGHHMVAMVSAIPRKAGTTFDCTDIESMASLRPLVLPDRSDRNLLPEGFAVRLPAGSRIVIQSHYINASLHEIAVADVARFHFAPAGSSPVEASYFILNSTGMDVPPHAPGSVTVTCTPPQRIQALLWFGHMHGFGKRIQLTRTRASSRDVLYDVADWNLEYRDVAPVVFYSQAEPLVMEPTDTLSLTCEYENPTDARLRFPTEMCTAISYYYPALPSGLVLCE